MVLTVDEVKQHLRIEFDEEVVLAQLLANEQLQWPCVDLGRNRPALAGEFLLDDRVEINSETGQHDQADKAELDRPAEPGASAARRLFFRGTGGSGTSHGRGLYALYRSSTDALRRFPDGMLAAIMAD